MAEFAKLRGTPEIKPNEWHRMGKAYPPMSLDQTAKLLSLFLFETRLPLVEAMDSRKSEKTGSKTANLPDKTVKEYLDVKWQKLLANISYDEHVLANLLAAGEKADSVHYRKIERNKDFKDQVVQCIIMQIANFEVICGALKLDLPGIEGKFELEKTVPHIGDALKKLAAPITTTAGAALVGAPIWVVIGSAIISTCLTWLGGRLLVKSGSKIEKKHYQSLIDVGQKIDGIQHGIEQLFGIVYRELAQKLGFRLPEGCIAGTKEEADKIVAEVKEKYGYELWVPDFGVDPGAKNYNLRAYQEIVGLEASVAEPETKNAVRDAKAVASVPEAKNEPPANEKPVEGLIVVHPESQKKPVFHQWINHLAHWRAAAL